MLAQGRQQQMADGISRAHNPAYPHTVSMLRVLATQASDAWWRVGCSGFTCKFADMLCWRWCSPARTGLLFAALVGHLEARARGQLVLGQEGQHDLGRSWWSD